MMVQVKLLDYQVWQLPGKQEQQVIIEMHGSVDILHITQHLFG